VASGGSDSVARPAPAGISQQTWDINTSQNEQDDAAAGLSSGSEFGGFSSFSDLEASLGL
jgi:hypothetical protein